MTIIDLEQLPKDSAMEPITPEANPLDARPTEDPKTQRKQRKLLPNAPPRQPVLLPMQAPFHSIGVINLFQGGQLVSYGTGFLCAPDVVLTARHVVLSKTFNQGAVWLGFDGQHNPAAPRFGVRSAAHHSLLDVAVLILDQPATQAPFNLAPATSQISLPVTLSGYGEPYPGGKSRLSMGTGPVNLNDATYLGYFINTRPGDSGAPVYIVHGGKPFAVAVHSAAADKLPTSNFGTRMSATLIHDIQTLIQHARGAST